jgi:HAD superfamily phosphoserine phosphatase-like hydrolase
VHGSKIFGYVTPREAMPAHIDAFVFDLDGTVTREEILPLIAREFGVSAQIDRLTAKTIRGDSPFEASLRERVDILGRFPVSKVRALVNSVELDRDILDFIERHRERTIIVTGNLDVWLTDLAARLPVPVRSSVAAIKNDTITKLVSIMDKRIETLRYSKQSMCAVGEGHNDLGMFENAAISVAYGGVHQPAGSLLDVASHAIFHSRTLCRFLSQL